MQSPPFSAIPRNKGRAKKGYTIAFLKIGKRLCILCPYCKSGIKYFLFSKTKKP